MSLMFIEIYEPWLFYKESNESLKIMNIQT